jgi:hypothetical protein
MTLEETLLQNLAEWRFDNGRQTLTVAHPETGWTGTVAADCSDRVGCHLWEVNLTRPETAPAAADLTTRAERLASRATGLMEPLRLIEVDVQGDTALLRSAVPQKRGDDLFYYEVLLRSAGAGVRRYQSSAKGARQQVAFPLTHEATAKLAADLTADA